MTNKTHRIQLRQGDVYLQQIDKLPDGAKEVPLEGGRIVLAHGEATGHAHAIADHVEARAPAMGPIAAAEIAEALIARCKAKLFEAGGDRYLVVEEPVSLTHEEHEPHVIPPGVYELPIQCEFDASIARRVAD